MSDVKFRKAFDIGRIPKNIDLTSPPVTGFDYLYRVRLETRKCPKVVVSDMDTTQFLSRQTVQVDPFNGFVRARPGFEPDTAWQDDQLETFISTRMEVFQNREELKEKFPKKDFPKITNEEAWCLFCLGSKIHHKIFPSRKPTTEGIPLSTASSVDSNIPCSSDSKQSTNIILHPTGSNVPDADNSEPKSKKSRSDQEVETTCDPGNPPLLSIVLHLNQTRVVRLLAFHINWLESAGFSNAQGRWLYALLMCLEKPLDPDTCAMLRSLARISSKLRADLVDPKDDLVLSINLVLSIISRFFDQKDMSDGFLMD